VVVASCGDWRQGVNFINIALPLFANILAPKIIKLKHLALLFFFVFFWRLNFFYEKQVRKMLMKLTKGWTTLV
jgi:hypothetical protein